MRESSVTSGVEFLTHPSVQPHSPEEKQTFLRSKGLTGEEIEEAFKRSGEQLTSNNTNNNTNNSNTIPPQQPTIVYAQPPPQESSWWNALAPLALAASGAASAFYLYKTSSGDEFPWEQDTPGLKPPPLTDAPIMNQNQPTMPAQQPQMPPNTLPPALQQQAQQMGLPGAPAEQLANLTAGQSSSNKPAWMMSSEDTSNSNNNNNNNNMSSDDQKQELDSLKKTVEEQASSIRELSESLKSVAESLKTSKNSGVSSSSSSTFGDKEGLQMMLQAMQTSSDVKAELNSMKTLLMASLLSSKGNNNNNGGDDHGGVDTAALLAAFQKMETSNNNNNNNTITASSSSSIGEQSKEEEEEKKPDNKEEEEEATTDGDDDDRANTGIRAARKKLADMVVQTNDDALLLAGSNLFLMFLKNILKEPLNPRFRRIARGNNNFKKCLEPLTGYMEFFTALGFEEKGTSQLELGSEWVEDLEKEDGWAKKILEDAIVNLEALKEEKSGAKSTSTTTNTTTTSSSTPTPPPVVQNTPTPPLVVQNTPTPPPVVQNTPTPPPVVQEEEETKTKETPKPRKQPPSYAEVLRMAQNGERPDDVKDIPDVLSSDSPSVSKMAPPPKPWEVQKEEENNQEEERPPAQQKSNPYPYSYPTPSSSSSPRIGGGNQPTFQIHEIHEDDEEPSTPVDVVSDQE